MFFVRKNGIKNFLYLFFNPFRTEYFSEFSKFSYFTCKSSKIVQIVNPMSFLDSTSNSGHIGTINYVLAWKITEL